MLDISLDENLETRFRSTLANNDPEAIAWLLRQEGVLIGLADSGAHVSQLCDACLPTDLLGNWVREKEVISLERAVHKLTGEPAGVFGLDRADGGRGVLREGMAADITVFDPDTVAPGPLRRIHDFPADGERLTADAPTGMTHTLVNGVPIRVDGEPVADGVSTHRARSSAPRTRFTARSTGIIPVLRAEHGGVEEPGEADRAEDDDASSPGRAAQRTVGRALDQDDDDRREHREDRDLPADERDDAGDPEPDQRPRHHQADDGQRLRPSLPLAELGDLRGLEHAEQPTDAGGHDDGQPVDAVARARARRSCSSTICRPSPAVAGPAQAVPEADEVAGCRCCRSWRRRSRRRR